VSGSEHFHNRNSKLETRLATARYTDLKGIFSAKSYNKQDVFPRNTRKERETKMKLLRHLLFAAIVVIGFSLTASAQRQPEEQRKKPKKENAEIKPEENKKPKNNENNNNENRNNENKGKKPQAFFLISENRIVVSSI